MSRLLTTGLLLLAIQIVQAGEVQHASVDYRDGDYSIDISVRINGDKDTIYGIATDYKQLSRLSDLIIEAGLINHTDADGRTVVRRRMVTKSCVLRFCFDAILIEDLWEPQSGIIKSVFIPEESDFLYGEAIWHVTRLDDTHTLVSFNSKFKPAFWIPPLIGPLLIKRMMLDAARQTIQNIEDIAALETSRP
jgi:hypothetical protein